MNPIIMRMLFRKFLIMSSCFLCAVLLLAFAFSQKFISPRGLGIARLIVVIGVATWAVMVVTKSAREFKVRHDPSRASIGVVTRKHRCRIWAARLAAIVLLLLFISGLRQPGPLWARLVGAAFSLSIIAAVIQFLVRLQRNLH